MTPRQPTEENKTMYMYWNSSNTKAWTHFDVEEYNMETYTEEVDDGVIDIEFKFSMEPMLAKRIYMDHDGVSEAHSIFLLKVIGPNDER